MLQQQIYRKRCPWLFGPCRVHSHQEYMANHKFRGWFDKGDDGGSGLHNLYERLHHRDTPDSELVRSLGPFRTLSKTELRPWTDSRDGQVPQILGAEVVGTVQVRQIFGAAAQVRQILAVQVRQILGAAVQVRQILGAEVVGTVQVRQIFGAAVQVRQILAVQVRQILGAAVQVRQILGAEVVGTAQIPQMVGAEVVGTAQIPQMVGAEVVGTAQILQMDFYFHPLPDSINPAAVLYPDIMNFLDNVYGLIEAETLRAQVVACREEAYEMRARTAAEEVRGDRTREEAQEIVEAVRRERASQAEQMADLRNSEREALEQSQDLRERLEHALSQVDRLEGSKQNALEDL
ncbi:unnamed protein product, partial [Symbiodinium necroappetens]